MDCGRRSLPLLLAVACGEPAAPAPEEGPESTGETAPVANADELFSLQQVPRFDLVLSEEAMASLAEEPKTYVAGTFAHGERVLSNVGIKLKGNHSFQPLSEKPSFKVKFNEYDKGGRFLGLEGLVLNSMTVDASMMREWVSYRAFAELGVPAPRAGFAEVWVNEEPYGLYLDLEPYDDEFLARTYPDPSGNLYEAGNGADLDADPEVWDQDEGKDESRADLIAFTDLARRADNSVFYGPEAVVDMPRFLAFLAGETIVGQFDGHIAGHNFYVYHEPTQDLWTYLPWSLDQTLIVHNTPYDHRGYLGKKCIEDPRCLVDYVLASQAALARFAAVDWAAEIDRATALTQDAVEADTRKPYTTEAVEAGRGGVTTWITARAAELEPQLDCIVDGAEPDDDGDGYGPCFKDCDDGEPEINAGVDEICDGIDNDCTGFVDDNPDCECPSVEAGGRTFYLCLNHIPWQEAEDFCEAAGLQLARFDNAAQVAAVWAAAEQLSDGRWAIGLNDRLTENDYRWLDGTAPDFDVWAAGEPAHRLDWFDCVFLQGGVWYELNCIERAALVCTDP